MQPFLSRSSRVPGTPCAISNVVLSTPRPTSEHGPTTTGTSATAKPAGYDGTSLLRKFGGFYGRFYSAMSNTLEAEDPAGVKKQHTGFPDVHDRSNICGGASTLNSSPADYDTSALASKAPPVYADPTRPALPARDLRTAVPSASPTTPAPVVEPFFRPPANLPKTPSRYPRTPPLSQRTEGIRVLVDKIHQYTRLTYVLEKEISKKSYLIKKTRDAQERERIQKELEELQKLYISVTTKHQDAEAASKQVEAYERKAAVAKIPDSLPDLPGRIPDYIPGKSPIELNKTLTELFSCRPLPRRLLLKVCFNLLVSTAAPDMVTFNILVTNFTRIRQSALAHMVFRSLLENGYEPDDYTIAAALNLGLKSSDYEFYMKVVGMIHRERSRKKPSEMTVKEYIGRRMVAAAMITAAAKFRKPVKATKFLADFRRDFPEAPCPGMVCLTGLLFLWTKEKERVHGLRVWAEMLKLDAGMKNQCEKLDLRAFHQMAMFCDAVDDQRKMDEVLQLAIMRGFTPQEVLGPPPKYKGLWLKRVIKVPRLLEISPAYWQHRPASDHDQGVEAQKRRAFNKLTESVMTSPWLPDPPTLEDMQDQEKYGDFDMAEEEGEVAGRKKEATGTKAEKASKRKRKAKAQERNAASEPESEPPPDDAAHGGSRDTAPATGASSTAVGTTPKRDLSEVLLSMLDQDIEASDTPPGRLSSQDRSDIWASIVQRRLATAPLCFSGPRSTDIESQAEKLTKSYKHGVEL